MTQQLVLQIELAGQQLRGLLTQSNNSLAPVVMILHPHPCYGGNMHHSVVVMIDRLLNINGYSTMRFDFRGAAGSQTEYVGVQGAVEDTLAFMKLLNDMLPSNRIALAGYSFGGSVALRIAAETDPLFLVSLSASLEILRCVGDERKLLSSIHCPTLLVHGERDDIVSIEDMTEISRLICSRDLKVLRLPDEDHFYTQSMQHVLTQIAAFLHESVPCSGTERLSR